MFSGAFPLEGWLWQVQDVAGRGAGEGGGWEGQIPGWRPIGAGLPVGVRVEQRDQVEWHRVPIPGSQRQLQLWSRRW